MGSPAVVDDVASALPAWIAVADHPRFPAATLTFAQNLLSLCEADHHLCAVFKDAGRYVATMSAVYLDQNGGLSVALLKQICAATGFLSPGRAEAIIEFLIHLDYLQPAGGAGSAAVYHPTELFLSAWRQHLKAVLDAAAMIAPALLPLSAKLDDPQVFRAFLAIQATRLHTLSHGPDQFPAVRRVFLHPYAGSQILWVLTVATAGFAGPADAVITVSLSDLARRFDVTHLHVSRFMKRADEAGLIFYAGRGRLTLRAKGVREIRAFFGFQLSELIASGRQTLALA